jgi:hypothetical protein
MPTPVFVPFTERPLCSKEEAKAALGNIGESTLYKLRDQGVLEFKKIGERTVVTTESLLRAAREGAGKVNPRKPPSPRDRRRHRSDDGKPPAAA